MEAVNGVSEGDKGGPPPPSPLTGCYLLIVIGEPHCNEHKDIILQRVAKGLLSWDVNDCLVDLEKELAIITEQALEGEEARYGERLIQFASENLVTEILIHPVVSTLAQCVRNLLSSFTRHRHIIHAGYTFANNGSWVLQDGTFSSTDFSEAFQEIEVLRVIRAYENGISLDLHCAPEGDWTRLPKEPFTKGCKVKVNPNDVLTAGSPSISSFINYLEPFLVSAELENILESSDVVGNIRFSRPTLYVFPGGQGDAALFGINGFNMLLDGGFSRKACFWDFVRHLDRLDAVLLTRLNNSNVNGISAVLRRKKQNALYPQIGHFFCNIQERKAILSPDGDKDKDPLLINLLDEGQEIVSNLRHLSLIPQVCYRDSEPINLYHKVGHGTLDMYVLSPAKDSKEVREFLQKWNNNDQKMFANQRSSKEFVIPLQNLVSICALLVWQPANPEDTITRILFPGSSPQNKIFEGLEKIKSLDFIKHPVCSEKSLAPATIIKAKQSVIERLIQPEKKIPLDNKKEKIQKPPAEIIDTEMKNGDVNGIQPIEKSVPVKKSDSTESEKSISKPKKIIENGEKIEKAKPKPRIEPRTKPRSESQQRKVKTAEKKPSPTTPKKQTDDLPKTKPKPSPSSTPAKSAKEATNRKVVESKIRAAPPKKEAPKPATEKKEVKVERKPISRRPKDISKLSGSPSKKVNGIQKPDSISRRGKLDKEGTTDSSTVSTPSAEQDSILKKEIKDISKLTTEEIQNLKAQELADLKEEQEAVKEIEAVFRKGELHEDKPSDFRKIKDISMEDKLESEEYIIIEKTEIEQDLVNESNKEQETQKIARDSEESEKQRKLSEEKETAIEENRMEIQDEVQKIITSATDIVKAKEEVVEASKEVSVTSPEEKIDVSTDKKDIEEIKETAQESQPDEKGSANIESGATTTAPTLPEDERMPLDEIKEDNGDQVIEEKHVKEDTKEKDLPVIQLPPKTNNMAKLPPVVGIRLDKQSHIRDIVKTPDEVADLPVHEEVEFDHYDEYPSATETKSEDVEAGKKQAAVEKEKTDVDVKDKEVKIEDKKEENTEAEQKEVKTVISEDLNKKELSKSPDEEKDTDEHELKQKKEVKDAALPTQVEAIKEEKVDVSKKVEEKVVKIEELDKRKDSLVQEEVVEKSEIEVKEKDEGKEKLDELKEKLPDVPTEEVIVEQQIEIEISTPKKEEAKLKEDASTIQKIEEKLQKLKDEVTEEIKTEPHLIKQAPTPPKKDEVELKENVTSLEKVGERLQKLKEETQEEHIQAVSEVITHKVEAPQHAEPVVIATDSLPESPVVDEINIEDKLHLGQKSPKEREEDVAKIVASVAVVLKSDAPLEEFEGKIPFSIPYKSYTTELRETHITTVESPVTDESKPLKEETICPKTSSISFIEEERKIAPIHEEQEVPESKISKMMKESNELMQATSKMIKDIKQTQPKEEEQDADGGTVHRMLVTASSEDGGEEIEICPPGTITFSRSSESSGRSSPDPMSQKQSQKSSIADTVSDATVITKSMTKDDKDVKEEEKTICDKKEVVEKVEVKHAPVTEVAPSKETLEKSEIEESSKAIEGIKEPVKDIKEETKPTKADEKVVKAEKIEAIEEKKTDTDVKPLEEKKEDKVEEHKEVSEEKKDETDVKLKEDIAVVEKTEKLEAAIDIDIKTLDEKEEEKEKPIAAEKAEKVKAVKAKDVEIDEKKDELTADKETEKAEKNAEIESTPLEEKDERDAVATEKIKTAELEKEIDEKLSEGKDQKDADKEAEKLETIDSEVEDEKKDILKEDKIQEIKEKKTETFTEEKEKTDVKSSNETEDSNKEPEKIEKLEVVDAKKVEIVVTPSDEKQNATKDLSKEVEKADITDVKAQPSEEKKDADKKVEKLKTTEEKKPEIDVKLLEEKEEVSKEAEKIETSEEKKVDAKPLEEKKEEIKEPKSLETIEEKKTEVDVKPLEQKEEVSKEIIKLDVSEKQKDEANEKPLNKKTHPVEETKEEKKTEIDVKSLEEKKDVSKEDIFDEEKCETDAKISEDKKEVDVVVEKLDTTEEIKTKVEVKSSEEKNDVKEVEKVELTKDIKEDSKPSEETKEQKSPKDAQKLEEHKIETDEKKVEVEEVVETLTKNTVNALESVKDEMKKVEDAAAAKVDTVEKEIEEKRSFLGSLVNDIGASLINDTSKLIEDAQQHIEDMTENAKSKIAELKEDLSSKKEIFENEIEAAEKVSEKKEKLIESVTEQVESTKETVEEQVKEVKEAVATQKATVTGVIADVTSAVTKEIETKVEEIKEQVIDTKEKTKTEMEEISKSATEEVKKTVDEKTEATKKVVEEIKEKTAIEVKELETKTEAVLENIKRKEENITKTIIEETKHAADKFEEKKEHVVEKMEDLSKDLAKVEIHAKDVVESTSSDISSVKKDVIDAVKKEDTHKYDLYNGLESVEKMVVDVLMADRKDSSTSDKTTVSSIVEKAEHDVEEIVDKGVSEVKEFVEETKEAISSFFKREPSKEEILEKAAHNIEENYEAVSDMAKSVVFEKCEEKIEKRLEKSAESLQKDYEEVADMAKSIVFEKCEKSLPEEQKEEKVLETAAKTLEEEYMAVSDMTQSVVFDKCENLTKVQKNEKVLEKSAKSLEEEYKEVSDMAQSIVFEKCEKPLTEEQKEEIVEKAAKNVEQEYKIVSDMAQSIVFDKCDLKEEENVATKVDDKKDGLAKLSGKSSPEKPEDDDLAVKLSGKSSPALSSDLKDIAKEGSGKSTPDIKEIDHIKVDNQDSLLSGKSSPGLSGKSSPILSGRSSPGLKAESKDSLLSEKSSPEHTKPDSKESSLSGKSSPALSGEVTIGEKEKVELSAKSSPAVSGKTSPAPSAGKSGKTTPDAGVEQITDRKSPELVTKEPIKDSEVCDVEKVEPVEKKSDLEALDKLLEPTTDLKSEKGELKTEKEEVIDKVQSQAVQEVSAKAPDIKSAIQEKKTETKEDKPESKTTLEVQETKEKKLSVSDVQISIKGSEEEKVAEKSTSDISKSESPDDTKQLDEKTETRELDSIDSGIGTEVDSKARKIEDVKTEQPPKDKDAVVKTLDTKEESIAGPSLSPPRTSTEDLHLSGKSTPDIAEVEKMKEMQESLKSEKHILGSTTPPTVPVSPIVKEISSTQAAEAKTSSPTPVKSSIVSSIKDSDIRSCTPGSDDYEIGASTHSDISSGQVSRAPHLLESERIESDEEDDVPGSPLSVTSQVAHSRSSSRYDFEDERIGTKMDPMNTSFYGALPDEEEAELDFEKAISEHRQTRGEDLVAESPSYLYEVTKAKFSVKTPEPESQLDQINKNGANNVMTASFMGDLPSSTTSTETKKDVVESWGKPLGLPSPAPPTDNRGTPKKERKLPANVSAKNKLNDDKKRAESPSKYKNKKLQPVYVDLTYVPHHGNAYYSYVDFFKRVRARYYVFSGIEPSREVYNALLEAKQTWEDKELEVTIIPTYDTDILGYWVAENEELLTKYKIDLSPSASRCTINLQDHETSCSAYRLEF